MTSIFSIRMVRRPGAAYRTTLAILLIGACGSAAAEVWVKVGQNEKFTAYADPASMHREGGSVKIWDMLDYKTAQPADTGRKYLSMKRRTEYDCRQGRMRVSELSYHSGNLGKGEVVSTAKVNFQWKDIAMGSADQLLQDLACGIQDKDKGAKR